jgi:hypothetical protein
MIRIAFASSALLLLTPFAAAQRAGAMGMPMAPHPGNVTQPLVDQSGRQESPRPAPGGDPACEEMGPRLPPPPPETTGAQLGGKDLKRAVAKVRKLQWHEDMVEARAQSAATGKPLLWLQSLGDLEGFA